MVELLNLLPHIFIQQILLWHVLYSCPRNDFTTYHSQPGEQLRAISRASSLLTVPWGSLWVRVPTSRTVPQALPHPAQYGTARRGNAGAPGEPWCPHRPRLPHTGGVGSVLGVVPAAIILVMLNPILTAMGINPNSAQVIQGVLIAGVMMVGGIATLMRERAS